MPPPITSNGKAAAVMTRDGLEFVFTTTTRPRRKDAMDAFYSNACAPHKPPL